MKRLSWLIATFAAGLLPGSPGNAITCGKASGTIERMICADGRLRQADAAMNAAYARILKAAGDAEMRAALVAGQKRWLAARDEQLGRLNEDQDAPDAAAWRDIVLKAIRDRTDDLLRRDADSPGQLRMIAAARAQRQFAARFTGGSFAGFDTTCDFLPSGNGYSYGCFGRQRYQHKDRVCTLTQDWASGKVTETHEIGRLVNGRLHSLASCSLGGGTDRACPGPHEPSGGWSAASGVEAPPAASLSRIDPDVYADTDTAWLPACLSGVAPGRP